MKKFEGFVVDGKPFFPLGAQAHNSSSYSREMFAESCRAAKALLCNTVEAPLYWEKVESREGGFDFSAMDYMLELCRASDLRLVILWFGSWKNGDMSYTPEWVKRDGDRFQRVLRSDGAAVADLSAHYRESRIFTNKNPTALKKSAIRITPPKTPCSSPNLPGTTPAPVICSTPRPGGPWVTPPSAPKAAWTAKESSWTPPSRYGTVMPRS